LGQFVGLNLFSPTLGVDHADELFLLFKSHQVSISPTFYALHFHTKVLREAFLYLHLRFELFLTQEYLRKCAHKILVKSTTGLNFTNILLVLFCAKVLLASFLYLHFRFVLFGCKNIGAKAALKMLVK
jgi:hypothetical protein